VTVFTVMIDRVTGLRTGVADVGTVGKRQTAAVEVDPLGSSAGSDGESVLPR